MKTIKLNAVMAGLLSAGALLMTVPVMSLADTDQGWDTFNSGDGQPIPVSGKAYMGTSLSSATAGQGWDAFNSGDGQRIPASNKAYQAASSNVPASGSPAVFGE